MQHNPFLKKDKVKKKKNSQKTSKFCYCCGTWHHFFISFSIIIWKENCKVLQNKDHVKCGKERFINPDRRAVTLVFRVRQLH
jgi:hypothetical protein